MSGKENVSAVGQQVNRDTTNASPDTMINQKIRNNATSSAISSATPKKGVVAEEDFPDDIHEAGGDADDMYGDALDSGWMAGLNGMRLIREAECLISCALLRRDNISQPCKWHGVFADALSAATEEATDLYSTAAPKEVAALLPVMCSISKIKTLWTQSLQTAINGAVLAALCLRFGPAWGALQAQLQHADSSEFKADRAMLRKKSYDAFSARTARPTLSLSAELDLRAVLGWMRRSEQALEVLELQVSRSALVMEPLRQKIGTPQLFGDLCRSLGMPGVSGTEVLPLCCSAMLHARLSADMPCPVEVLEKYCRDRALLASAGSKVRPMLMSLLLPKQHVQE